MNFEHLDDPAGFTPDDAFRAAAQRDGRRRRRRRRLALTSGSLAASLLLVVVAAGGYGLWRTSGIDRVPVDFTTEPVDLGEPFNILLVGSDSRVNVPDEISVGHTDTMLVLRIEPEERRVLVLSLPRDLLVQPDPSSPLDRLNVTFAKGGPDALVAVVEGELGIPISAYAQVGFDGVVQLVDDVGGLPLSVSSTMRDESTGLHLEASECSTLDGPTVLALLRSRHVETPTLDGRWTEDPTSDIGRMARQRAVIGMLLPRLGELADSFGGINAAVSVLDDHVTIDSRLSLTEMVDLARWATEGDPPTVEEVSFRLKARMVGAMSALQLDVGADEVVAAMGGRLPASAGVAPSDPASGAYVPPAPIGRGGTGVIGVEPCA